MCQILRFHTFYNFFSVTGVFIPEMLSCYHYTSTWIIPVLTAIDLPVSLYRWSNKWCLNIWESYPLVYYPWLLFLSLLKEFTKVLPQNFCYNISPITANSNQTQYLKSYTDSIKTNIVFPHRKRKSLIPLGKKIYTTSDCQ